MKITYKHSLLCLVIAFAVTMFFSCDNNFKAVQNIGILDTGPLTIAENINSKYTDSGQLKSILVSPKMLNYSNRDFAFYEFPEGVNLTLFENKNQKSTIVADYAIVYNKTSLIDLRGNVKILTYDNDSIFADQLYYDRAKEWFFTNQPITIFKPKDKIFINSNGFDANNDFTNIQFVEVTGEGYLNE